MRRNNIILFVLSLLLTCVVHAQEVKPSQLEYWFDTNFDTRQSLPTEGTLSQPIDVSGLCTGIHTLEMRVSDTKGRWGVPIMKYFLKSDETIGSNALSTYTYWFDQDRANAVTAKVDAEQTLDIDISALCPGIHALQLNISDIQGRKSQTLLRYFLALGEDPTQRQLTTYRYWIDDFSYVHEGTTVSGQTAIDIDVSTLCKGIHTLSYQVADNMGRMSAPRMLYFLIPDWQQGDELLTAYEYWFNHGPRHRVQTDSVSVLSLNDVVIEVKDVVPNCIADDYVFDAATEMVTTPDNVFFGLQVFNAAEVGSVAVLSDTFAINVPVDPHFLLLGNGEEQTFTAPTTGLMQGLKTTTNAGDSLLFTISTPGLQADFYDADGNMLEATKSVVATGETYFSLCAATDVSYALLYGASDAFAETTVSLVVSESGGIGNAQYLMNNGKSAIYNLQGQRVDKAVRGLYIIDGKKMLVK